MAKPLPSKIKLHLGELRRRGIFKTLAASALSITTVVKATFRCRSGEQVASISLEVFFDHEFELPSGFVITLVTESVVQVPCDAAESIKQRRVKVTATTAF